MRNEVKSCESTGCIDFRTAKQDIRPKKGWWAPGNYLNRCRLCGCGFIGDKRAGHCADCEYNDEAKPPSVSEVGF